MNSVPHSSPAASGIPSNAARAATASGCQTKFVGAQREATRLHPAQRARDLAAAATGVSDVLIIGAGVTGCGAALDAAARGLSVVLVEAGDVAMGTSSRSGKTFHGGLRYLEQFNFKLVAHAIEERDLMLRTISPHMAWPEAFVYPLRKQWERPYVGAGVLLYDLFGLRSGAVPRQRHFGRRGLKQHLPSIDTTQVVGGIQYYDALMDDARHTLQLARTAAGLGARVLIGMPVQGFLKDAQGRVQGVSVRDKAGDTSVDLRARCVINACGVWADELQQLAGAKTFHVQPAKGVHLLLRPEAISGEAGILARADDSVIIARRWYGYWLLGTTDTPWSGDKARPYAERADIDYLLDNINRYLARKVGLDDVLGVYAGLRPLLKPVEGSGNTSALSRDHAVLPGPSGLTTVVGGKFTTYRRMAADAVDAAIAPLGISAPCRTAQLPLLGAHRWRETRTRAREIGRVYQLDADTVAQLLRRHGDAIDDVLELIKAQPELGRPIAGAPRYLLAELVYAVTAEGARSLADVMVRRTHLSIELPDGGQALAPEVVALIAPHLGWGAAARAAQLAAYTRLLDDERQALAALRQGQSESESACTT